ncbi:hypothetical protein ACTFIW_004587 [Dictyostelium discoideum]
MNQSKLPITKISETVFNRLNQSNDDINNNTNNNTNNNNNNNNNTNNKNNNINYLLKPINEINENKILNDPSNENGLKQLFYEINKYYNNFGSKLIFFSLIGSESFNLNIESSDQDFFGVYECDIDQILSFESYYYNRIPIEVFQNNNSNNSLQKDRDRDNIINPNETIIHLKPDITIHEIRHFSKLLLLGNPKLIEPLFIENFCSSSQSWLELIKNRKLNFYTITCLTHYYSTVKVLYFDIKSIFENDKKQEKQGKQNEKSLNDRKSIFKKSYHIIRLLIEMNDIINYKDIRIYLPNQSEERKLLMKIREGEEIDIQSCFELVQSKYLEFESKFNELKKNSTNDSIIKLNSARALHVLNDWVIDIRRNSIENSNNLNSFKKYKFENENHHIDESNNSFKIAMDLMNKNNIKGTLIYFGPSGSHLHGLQDDDENGNDNEKIDWIGIYAAPTDDIVSLFPPALKHDSSGFIMHSNEHIGINLNPAPDRPNNQNKKDSFSKGIILYELKYALQLIVNCSYRVLECVFISSSQVLNNHPFKNKFYITDAWKDFINQVLINDDGDNNNNNNNKTFSKLSNSNLIQQYWGLAKGISMKNSTIFKMVKSNLLKKKDDAITIGEEDLVTDDSISKNLFFLNYLLIQCNTILNGIVFNENNTIINSPNNEILLKEKEIPSIFIDKQSKDYQFLMSLKHNKLNKLSIIQSLIIDSDSILEEIRIKLDTLKKIQRIDLVEFETIKLLNSFYNKVRKSL